MIAPTTTSITVFRLSSALRTIPPNVTSVPIRSATQFSSVISHPLSSSSSTVNFISVNYKPSSYRNSIVPSSLPNQTSTSSKVQTSPFAALTNGQLANDTMVSALLKERLSRSDCNTNGWVLDGYPRTVEQAITLVNSKSFQPQLIVELVVNRDNIRSRLENRRRDPLTNKTYNLNNLPSDPHIQQRLVVRPDDKPEIIDRRFRIYDDIIPSVKDVFTSAGIPIVRVVAPKDASAKQVFKKLSTMVGGYHKIVLIGAPGCGKGTQGSLLNQTFNLVHVSTGDLLREAATKDSMSTSTFTEQSRQLKAVL